MPLIIYLVFLVAVAYGWINNILNIIEYEVIAMTPLIVLQTVGIFVAPLGVVLGWVV